MMIRINKYNLILYIMSILLIEEVLLYKNMNQKSTLLENYYQLKKI